MCRDWRDKLESHLGERSGPSEIEIEDKGYSLALHYRRCRDQKKAKTQILKAIERLYPSPRVIPGKCVVNILPPGAPHKGVALMELMAQAGVQFAFYIGDDDTD